MYRKVRTGALLAALALIPSLTRATIVPHISFETLTDSSEVIVSGHITRSWSAWDTEHKYIWTHYELGVTAAYKGVVASTVAFAEPGGVVDGRAMVIEGAVRYAAGDNVVVFLARMPNRYLRTAGWEQGKYELDGSGRLRGSQASLNGITAAELRRRVSLRLPGAVR